MAELIASGVTAANSVDIVLASGADSTIGLFAAAGVALSSDTSAVVQRKGSNGEYYSVPDSALYPARTAVQIAGPGTYRVRKEVSGTAFGVSQD